MKKYCLINQIISLSFFLSFFGEKISNPINHNKLNKQLIYTYPFRQLQDICTPWHQKRIHSFQTRTHSLDDSRLIYHRPRHPNSTLSFAAFFFFSLYNNNMIIIIIIINTKKILFFSEKTALSYIYNTDLLSSCELRLYESLINECWSCNEDRNS